MPNISPPSPSSSRNGGSKYSHHSGLAVIYDLIYKEQYDLALAALSRCIARDYEVCKFFIE